MEVLRTVVMTVVFIGVVGFLQLVKTGRWPPGRKKEPPTPVPLAAGVLFGLILIAVMAWNFWDDFIR